MRKAAAATQTTSIPLTDAEYVAKAGTVCPGCHSEQIEGGSIEVDLGTATQPMTCNDCGAEWTDVYQLTGFSNLVVANSGQ